jgi:hypothetical protein
MSEVLEDQETDVGAANDQLIMICGFSGEGKSASLRHIRNQQNWMYLNCEAGKRLPFANKFDRYTITDPYQVHEAFDAATHGQLDYACEGIVIDSGTFLMEMFETMYVLGSADTMKGWSQYQQFWKTLMQQKVAAFGKPVLITAHLLDVLDEKSMSMKTSVPIKGALKNNGLEAYFSTVVSATKVPLKELEKFGNKMLEITEDEKELGFKHVYQTRITKQTTGMRLRSPMGMFKREETYIDNDAQKLLDHLNEFYDI